MQLIHMPDFTLLENNEELNALIIGDVIKIDYKPRGTQERHMIGAYGGTPKDEYGMWAGMKFIVPVFGFGKTVDYIQLYQSRREDIQVKDSRIILYEDKTRIQSFTKDNHTFYPELDKVLIKKGISHNNKELERRARYNLTEAIEF